MKLRKDLVSVIVPTYNRVGSLPRALESALLQTHRNLEIIVIDDGSTDLTRKMIDRCYGQDARVRYVYQQNQRVSAARNRGLALAQGDYIAFLDSDDRWEPWKLEVQVNCMNRCPEIGMVWTDMQAINAEGKIVDAQFLRKMYSAYRWFSNAQLFSQAYDLDDWCKGPLPVSQSCPGEYVGKTQPEPGPVPDAPCLRLDPPVSLHIGDIYSPMIMGNLVHTSTVLLRRDRAEKVKAFDASFRNIGEDYDFHLRTCKEGPVGFVNVASIQYQIGMEDRLTRREHSLEGALNFLTVITRELEQERDRITLSPTMIQAVLIEAHNWAGYELLGHGRLKEARSHFVRSLYHEPFQPRTLKLLFAASLSSSVLKAVRRAYRSYRENRSPMAARLR